MLNPAKRSTLVGILNHLQRQKLDKVSLLLAGEFVRVFSPNVPRYYESVPSDPVSLKSFFSSATADVNPLFRKFIRVASILFKIV